MTIYTVVKEQRIRRMGYMFVELIIVWGSVYIHLRIWS